MEAGPGQSGYVIDHRKGISPFAKPFGGVTFTFAPAAGESGTGAPAPAALAEIAASAATPSSTRGRHRPTGGL
jgi:hypothetical protein